MLLYKGINRFSDVGGDGVYVARGIDNNDVFAVLEQLKRAVIPLAYCVHLLRVALEFGDVTLDPSTGLLACSDRSVRLSGREYQVMELFMRSPNIVFSADKIMERVWGWDSDAEINVIWVHISNLRKKLRSIGSKITIRAVRGLGYALEESDD